MIETPPALAATAGGSLLVLAILLPVAGILLSFVLGGRFAERVALGIMPVGLAIAIAIAVLVWRSGAPIVYNVAGLPPPLGIALRADGISAVMLVTAALVIAAAAFYARANFATPEGVTRSARAAGVLDPASGDLGGADHSFRRRGSVQSLCRAGVADLRRGPAGLPRGKAGDAGRRAPLPAVRAVRLGLLPARRRAALRRLWHARHRAAGGAGAGVAGRVARGGTDDGRAARQDRALSRCISGCLRRTPTRRRPPAPSCPDWSSRDRSS